MNVEFGRPSGRGGRSSEGGIQRSFRNSVTIKSDAPRGRNGSRGRGGSFGTRGGLVRASSNGRNGKVEETEAASPVQEAPVPVQGAPVPAPASIEVVL